MGNNIQQSEIKTQVNDEISLLDVLCFFKVAYKIILVFGVAGSVIALAYLAVTPKQYEAVAQIAMAQFGAANNNLNPLGINIEDPSLLIARLSLPTSFTPQVLSSCGKEDTTNPGASLAKAIKLAPPKGVANVVELKTFGQSPEAASTCTQAIFELIKVTQAQILAPYIEEAKTKLADDEERLIKAKDLVTKADKTGQAVGAAYLSTRDEIRYLLDEITSLKNVVTGNQNRATRLIAPIYVSDTPIAPKKRVVLIAGLLGGLFLGLLLALAGQMWIKLKADMQEQEQGQAVR
ncbi:Wzz/FepE/Etk N-terminal domain-containing protein [Polynucleobacter sp. AP-Nino-20-G2]|uniref:Wzz/FepE/Etk N-terminal domain-containing protein n=1 Tax=Polynucleobacter sp. AP-Nino-20-G2 TaxID=2576917 RepID=UPI001BFE496A|nr:Wzz/FepE/Etk N-terminal domain-containing protein [Polynucleobacter sp. AP-Nino-20-G2]QWE16943.1 hypothetical protein FD960_01585 [Polynucleobacter sp. AP-Nino-20-G2]